MNKKVWMVTGGAGFIGANFLRCMAQRHPRITWVNVDAMTYAAHPEAIDEQKQYANICFEKADIVDRNAIRRIFTQYHINGVIHFAAESHVDNSIASPEAFIRTNVQGTYVLLDVAYQAWRQWGELQENRFHHVSTDRVYGSLGSCGVFTEETPYAPTNPYAVSKASSDFLALSYFKTYGMNVTVSNCSNNFGPWQHGEKLIPTVIRCALEEKPIPLYGNGRNVRDWLWVRDHCDAIDRIMHHAKPGSRWNVGGSHRKSNIRIVHAICAILDRILPRPQGSYADLITYVKDRPGHDFRYAMDASRIQKRLGWQPTNDFLTQLRKTVLWYIVAPHRYQKSVSVR